MKTEQQIKQFLKDTYTLLGDAKKENHPRTEIYKAEIKVLEWILR